MELQKQESNNLEINPGTILATTIHWIVQSLTIWSLNQIYIIDTYDYITKSWSIFTLSNVDKEEQDYKRSS